MKEDVIIAKLVKMYILHHPKCTAKDISEYINTHNFGIRRVPNSREIAAIITNYNSAFNCKWFCVDVANKNVNSTKKYIILNNN